jgi:hypothetical protein
VPSVCGVSSARNSHTSLYTEYQGTSPSTSLNKKLWIQIKKDNSCDSETKPIFISVSFYNYTLLSLLGEYRLSLETDFRDTRLRSDRHNLCVPCVGARTLWINLTHTAVNIWLLLAISKFDARMLSFISQTRVTHDKYHSSTGKTASNTF